MCLDNLIHLDYGSTLLCKGDFAELRLCESSDHDSAWHYDTTGGGANVSPTGPQDGLGELTQRL